MRLAVVASCGVLLLAGCGEADRVEQASSTADTATASAEATDDKPAGALLETGFAQSDIYVALVAVVENRSDTVGQTVTVQFNVKDASGALLKSESQVESFSRVGQKLPVQTQAEMPAGKKAAKVEATLLVEDNRAFSSEPFPEIKTGPVTVSKAEYGDGFAAKVELTNPKTEPLKSPRLDIVCYDAAKKIVGSGFAFPELVPPSGKAVEEVDLITSGKPANCVAYASPSPLED